MYMVTLLVYYYYISPYHWASSRGTSHVGSVLLQELHDAGVTQTTRNQEGRVPIVHGLGGFAPPLKSSSIVSR